MIIVYENEKLNFIKREDFLNFICPMIRDRLNSVDEIIDVSSTEVTDMGIDIWISLSNYNSEDEFLKIFDDYMQEYISNY